MTTLSDRLKQSRKNAGLTQSAVAQAVGITQPTYQALEAGKVTKSSYLLQIAEVLKVDTHWLATGEYTAGKPPSESDRTVILPKIELSARQSYDTINTNISNQTPKADENS